jgi:hypothetical protein
MKILKLQSKWGQHRGTTADDRLTVQWITGKTIIPASEVYSLVDRAKGLGYTTEVEVLQ